MTEILCPLDLTNCWNLQICIVVEWEWMLWTVARGLLDESVDSLSQLASAI